MRRPTYTLAAPAGEGQVGQDQALEGALDVWLDLEVEREDVLQEVSLRLLELNPEERASTRPSELAQHLFARVVCRIAKEEQELQAVRDELLRQDRERRLGGRVPVRRLRERR